jgi:DNA-3-methyladenine glycosylase
LQPEFYQRETLTVARELLGKRLVHESPDGVTAGRIVEVEAYIGPDDRAAHSYNNRRSKRTEIQYGPGGHAYVFLIYGMYNCFNIVTQMPCRPEVVLVRALEPVAGLELMARRRKIANLGHGRLSKLTGGPGRLCQAMEITMRQYGSNLCSGCLYLLDDGTRIPAPDILATPRINIDYAGEARDYLWRFIIRGNPHVSVEHSEDTPGVRG